MHIPPTLLLEEKLLFSGIPLGYPSINQGFIDFYWNELNLVQRMCRKENATGNLIPKPPGLWDFHGKPFCCGLTALVYVCVSARVCLHTCIGVSLCICVCGSTRYLCVLKMNQLFRFFNWFIWETWLFFCGLMYVLFASSKNNLKDNL